jgi:hypothetical protein
MNKDKIINKLMMEYDVWECGYTRIQLEDMTKKELLKWLKNLED